MDSWKLAVEAVDKRNAEARKAGRQRRKEYEDHKEAARRDAERRRMAELVRRQAGG